MDQLPKVKKILLRSTNIVCDNLDPKQLLRTMQSAEALTYDDLEHIKNKVTKSDQSEELLDILRHKPTKSYDAFMDALLEIDRKDIHDSIKVIEEEVGYTRHGAATPRDSSGSSSHRKPSTDYSENASAGPSRSPQTAVRVQSKHLGATESLSHVVTSTIGAPVAAIPQTTPSASVLHAPSSTVLEAKQKQIVTGPWKMIREFGKQDGPGKLTSAHHVAFSPNGDVVIADYEALKIKIYSIDGIYKSKFDTVYGQPQQIAISSDNTCFVTGHGREHITMYELSLQTTDDDDDELGGKLKGSFKASCPEASSPAPVLYGLAIDHAGDLLLGDIKNKYIYKHKQDGTHLDSIKVDTCPKYIAVTSQGTIVAADFKTAPQIMTKIGKVLHSFKPPVNEPKWRTYNVYCHDGIIFISGDYISNTMCFSESGQYLGSMQLPRIYPCNGLALTSDSKTLVVYENKLVKVFNHA